MSDEKAKYYAVATVVDDFLDDYNLHNGFFQKALKWALRAVREIRLDTFQHPKTLLLDVTERRTVVLPDGFVDWTKIAVKKGQYAITLAVNDDLTIGERSKNDTDVVTGLLSQHMPNGTNLSAYGGFMFNNFNGTNFLGFGGGLPSKGYCKVVDHGDCKEIYLDYDYNYKQVYLEYITDGIEPCGETVIHPYEYNYVMAFMADRYENLNNPKATVISKDEAGKDLYFAGKQLRGRYNDLDPRTIITMDRKEARVTTKL